MFLNLETPALFPPISAAQHIIKPPNLPLKQLPLRNTKSKFSFNYQRTKIEYTKGTKPTKNLHILSQTHVPINAIDTFKEPKWKFSAEKKKTTVPKSPKQLNNRVKGKVQSEINHIYIRNITIIIKKINNRLKRRN